MHASCSFGYILHSCNVFELHEFIHLLLMFAIFIVGSKCTYVHVSSNNLLQNQWKYYAVPKELTTAHFIHQKLKKQPSFPLHSDFRFSDSDLHRMQSYVQNFEWFNFQDFETEKFITNASKYDTVINVIENKLRTEKYIQKFNEIFANDTRAHILSMPSLLCIHYQSWLKNKNDSLWWNETLLPFLELQLQTPIVLKPTHSSRGMGVKFRFPSFGKEGLVSDINDIFENEELNTRGTPQAMDCDKAVIIQNGHFGSEIKLYVIFGHFYYGVFEFGNGGFHYFTFNKVCSSGELCEILNKHLSPQQFDEIVYKSELMARQIGAYNIRFDWFIDDGTYGVRFNEMAFPNFIASDNTNIPKNEIIHKVLSEMEGSVFHIRHTRNLFDISLDSEQSQLQPLNFACK